MKRSGLGCRDLYNGARAQSATAGATLANLRANTGCSGVVSYQVQIANDTAAADS